MKLAERPMSEMQINGSYSAYLEEEYRTRFLLGGTCDMRKRFLKEVERLKKRGERLGLMLGYARGYIYQFDPKNETMTITQPDWKPS